MTMAAVTSRNTKPAGVAPRRGPAWFLRRPSSTGMSGFIFGGLVLGYAVGPLGTVIGMVVGLLAGEALEKLYPSDSKDASSHR